MEFCFSNSAANANPLPFPSAVMTNSAAATNGLSITYHTLGSSALTRTVPTVITCRCSKCRPGAA